MEDSWDSAFYLVEVFRAQGCLGYGECLGLSSYLNSRLRGHVTIGKIEPTSHYSG